MNKKNLLLALMFITAILFTACKKDDPVIPDEPELITTLNYSLTPIDGGSAVILSFQDLDGDGGNAPTINGGTLEANTSYTGILELLNEAATPVENITEEVEEEAEDHQFFFQSDLSNLSFIYNDTDANNNPIGITTTLTTGDTAAGNITIILRHEPNKIAAGVSDGDISNAGGETDIEVTFPINVL